MKFIIKLNKGNLSRIEFKYGMPNLLEENVLYFYVPKRYFFLSKNFLLLGFKNYSESFKIDKIDNLNYWQDCINGKLFYLIEFKNNKLIIYNGFLSLLPVYIYESGSDILISSHISLIKKFAKNLDINKQYILQQNLFNYSFSDETIFKQIKMLKTNYYLIFDGNLYIKQFDTIERYFVEVPKSWKKSIDDLVELFIEVNKNSIVDGDFISFTSGFDGRSLVALSKYYKKKIYTFSFGSEKNEDITIPKEQAEKLGIPYLPILLNKKNYLDEFWHLGGKIIKDNGCSTTFLQVHWPFSAKIISRRSENIVSGVFGSELFRAVHLPGQFLSPALIEYFKHLETDEWINKIKNAESLKFLNLNNFKKEIEELIEFLNDYRYKVLYLNKSQRLYKFVFEEAFRKFFGLQILQPQLSYINLKIPFFNFKFVTELFKTELAGLNNPFFTQNPFTRFKGQLFYAKFIERTFPKLLFLKTGKGYKPYDLLTFFGKVRIAKNFLHKRFKRKMGKIDLDNLGILSAYQKNIDEFDKIPNQSEFFNIESINQYRRTIVNTNNELIRDKFFETLSINYFLGNIK